MRINNTYSESFRVNAVAVVRSGYAVSTTAKRLGMPEKSLRNWMKHPKYTEVQPAGEEVLAVLPESQVNETKLVPIIVQIHFLKK